MRSADYKAAARRALQGHWGISILVILVAGLLSARIGGNSLLLTSASSAGSNTYATTNPAVPPPNTSQIVFVHWESWLAWAVAGIGVCFAVYSIIVFFFGGATTLGIKLYNTRLIQAQPQKPFSTLFERFSIFGRALLLQLLTALFIFLWSSLFIIPGIVAAYRYAMAPYIMAQNPNISALDAIRASKQMMTGHKAQLFCLQLSFIGWWFLCILTAGIGFLWLHPYKAAAAAAFYINAARKQNMMPSNIV